MKIVVLERNSVGLDVSVDEIKNLGETVMYPNTTAADVKEKVRDAEIIVANKAPLNEETLKDAADVKLICEFATGYDNVDLAYCKSRGIKVANVVNYSTDAVAQHTFALCFYVLEKLRHYDEYVKSGAYAAQDRFSNFDLPLRNLRERHGELQAWAISEKRRRLSPRHLGAGLFFTPLPVPVPVQSMSGWTLTHF